MGWDSRLTAGTNLGQSVHKNRVKTGPRLHTSRWCVWEVSGWSTGTGETTGLLLTAGILSVCSFSLCSVFLKNG